MGAARGRGQPGPPRAGRAARPAPLPHLATARTCSTTSWRAPTSPRCSPPSWGSIPPRRSGRRSSTTSARRFPHEVGGSHALVGAEIARRFGEDASIVHGIEAHHNEVEPRTLTAILVQAADTVSAARPGARREALEGYVRRLEKLERIASDFSGVDRVYAMQAGREIRVVVDPGHGRRPLRQPARPADRPASRGRAAVSRPDRGHRDPGVPGHGLRPLSTTGDGR